MSAKDPDWPDISSDLLTEFVRAFQKRAKAIRYRTKKWDTTVRDDDEYERLNMDFEGCFAQIRLSIWNDGQLWFRACRGGKSGWDLNYSFFVEAERGAAIQGRDAFESSLDFIEDEEHIWSIWQAFNPN